VLARQIVEFVKDMSMLRRIGVPARESPRSDLSRTREVTRQHIQSDVERTRNGSEMER
jgi:hypothetical protein